MRRHPALRPLSRDHHHGLLLVRALRWALEGREGRPPDARERLQSELRSELLPHFEREEAGLEPHLGEGEARWRLKAEHELIRARGTEALRASDRALEVELARVADALAAHIEWEERDLFPALEVALPPGPLGALGARLCAGEPLRECRIERRPEACLFDLDGTLIDSIPLIRASYEHTLAAHGKPWLGEEHWLEGLGRPLRWQFARFEDRADEVDAMVRTYRAHNLEHHDRSVQAFPGALEAVRELHARGMRLAIVTSKQNASAQRGLALCGFAELFEVVVGADDVATHKPDPAPVHCALERLGLAAPRAVMVGDSPHDLNAGRAAGARTAAAAWGPFAHDTLRSCAPDLWLLEPCEIAGLPRQLAH